MTCVQTVEYSILVNGLLTKEFTPSRGIRQEDHLSLLFLFCAEGLLYMLSDGLQRGDLKGATVSCGGPKLSHLFIVDGSLLFGVANERKAFNLVAILQQYGAVSGQQINLNQLSIFSNRNTPVMCNQR